WHTAVKVDSEEHPGNKAIPAVQMGNHHAHVDSTEARSCDRQPPNLRSFSCCSIRNMQTEHRADSLRMGHCFDGTIRARRYLCRCCKRTVSLLPEFALPYLRFGIVVIAMFLVARILLGLTLK